MDTGITLNPQRRAALVASGAWQDQTLLDYLDTTVARTPDRPAIIGYRVGDDTRTELSYRDLDQTVTRMAAGAWQPWASSRRRGRLPAAKLVADHRPAPGLPAHRRHPEPADAHLSGTGAALHAGPRRSPTVGDSQALSGLRLRGHDRRNPGGTATFGDAAGDRRRRRAQLRAAPAGHPLGRHHGHPNPVFPTPSRAPTTSSRFSTPRAPPASPRGSCTPPTPCSPTSAPTPSGST